MDFPVSNIQMIPAKPVIGWMAETAQQYSVHPTVVVNALLRDGMYAMTTQGEEGIVTRRECMQTVNTSTPVEEEKPW